MHARVLGLGAAMLLLLVSCPLPVIAAAAPAVRLLLEIWVNGYTHHAVVPVIERNGVLFMNADDLAACNIKINPAEIPRTGLVAVNRLTDIDVKLQNDEQRLQITAADDRLLSQVFDLRGPSDADHAHSDTGFIGSYNFVSTIDDFDRPGQTANGGMTLGGTMFTPEGFLTTDGFSQTQNGIGHFIRLDTTAEIDEPGVARRTIFGDAVSGGLNWSRSVRFGGVQIATDFSLRPDLATMPLPAFFGQTAVPATVDVYVNAARVFETNVDSGPFQINNLPIVTGNGQATIVTRDVLGQETTSTLPFYATDQLLRKGLEAYDVDVGAVREAYGQTGFDYGEPAATGTYSVGVTEGLTLETHAETTRQLQLAGGGAIFSLGDYGVMHVAAAASSYDNDGHRSEGALSSLSAQTQQSPVNLFGSVTGTYGAYSDIATIGSLPPPAFQAQIGGNIGLDKDGSLALSWIESRTNNQSPSRLVSATYTLALSNRINFALTSFYDVVNHTSVSEALLTASLGDGWTGQTSLRNSDRTTQEEAGVTKPVNTDGGVGYQFLATAGETDTKQGEINWINSSSNLDAALASNHGVQSGRFTASGGIVALDGSIYATQYPNGAVALVKTGQPDVRVYRENREVATTDSDGEALLTNFTPFTANRISVDPRDYDLATILDTTEKTVVPCRQSGVIVNMTPAPRHPAVLVLRDQASGAFPPVGARVTLDDNSETGVVGHDGEVYIADLHQPIKGVVDYHGGACHFEASPPDTSKDMPIPRLDPVPCIPVTAP